MTPGSAFVANVGQILSFFLKEMLDLFHIEQGASLQTNNEIHCYARDEN